MNTEFFSNRKNVIGLVIVLLLVVAIPLGVYLAQRTQIFKPRANQATTEPIKFKEGNGVSKDAAGNYTTTTPTVEIELTSPFGAPSQ